MPLKCFNGTIGHTNKNLKTADALERVSRAAPGNFVIVSVGRSVDIVE
ncbi:hypothetical protein CLOSTASPAR_00664 [[Clostridium] asparagiforme DSM 15981]|uniref:Uncharacterized protein n=1 Tax=[Clostridium] asparagiforme DSM 15981 TaxID=518636 RepID=C0CUH4_9FIRM|nr:hypothetical protein CLOSTASPAR_00664 [[Clostridium] asparagiforme DSM 15981]